MTILNISDTLALIIQNEARERGQSIEDYLRAIIVREQTLEARQKIEQDQRWWMNLPLKQRAEYMGEYVAVQDRRLIDHDRDENALRRRVRGQYGDAPVLLMPAEGSQDIIIHSPHIIRDE